MSNFVCPTCGFTNIDCGKDGYKTRREIDFEQEITRLTDLNKQYSYLIKQRDIHNKELEEKIHILTESQMKNENTIGYLATKLEIAIKALEKLSEETLLTKGGGRFVNTAARQAQEALKEIKE